MRYLTGSKLGYNPQLLATTISIFLFIIVTFILATFYYFRKFGEEQLTLKHILSCLGLWVFAKILLIPSFNFDIVFHQVWKVIGVIHSFTELYHTRCFALDYSPLMAFFENIWGHVLYLFASEEFSLERTFNISFKFYALLRLTVIVTDLFYFFTLLALLKLITTSNTRMR